jgi:hypothetical protein
LTEESEREGGLRIEPREVEYRNYPPDKRLPVGVSVSQAPKVKVK